MAYNFYAFMDRMKYIKRWSLMRSTREENIMEHTQQVALFAHALATIENTHFGGNVNVEKTVLYALYHECSEVLTGDLPTPIKYFNSSIQEAYHSLEEVANDKLLATLPPELAQVFADYVHPEKDTQEYALMKCADRLAAYVKCLEELRSGNSEFTKAKKSIEEDLLSKGCRSLDYFMQEFIPAFHKSLDELE